MDGFSSPITYDTWQRVEVTFDTPQAAVGIRAHYFNGEVFPGNYYVDSIHFITVPEPSTWVLIVTGSTALIFCARHRKRYA